MASSGMLQRVALVRTDQVFLHSVRRLLVTASIVPSSPILVTLIKEALSSSETSVLTRATWHNIPEDAILHCLLVFVENEGNRRIKEDIMRKFEITATG
jgi:hypothetical protein